MRAGRAVRRIGSGARARRASPAAFRRTSRATPTSSSTPGPGRSRCAGTSPCATSTSPSISTPTATASSPGAKSAPPGRGSRPTRRRASPSTAARFGPASAASSGEATAPMRCCTLVDLQLADAAGDPLFALHRGRPDPSRHRQGRAARRAGGTLRARPGAGGGGRHGAAGLPHRRGRIGRDRVEAPSRWQFLEEGIRHILGGYDHVLFLLCLLLPAVMRRRDGAMATRRAAVAGDPAGGRHRHRVHRRALDHPRARRARAGVRCRRGSSSRRSR